MRFQKTLHPMAAVLICAVLVPGCASAGHAAKPTPGETRVSSGTLEGNPSVQEELEVLRPRVESQGRDKLLVFELRNRSSEPQTFAFSIEWSDRTDKHMGASQREWTIQSLDAGASFEVRAAFPAGDAESWRLLAVRPEEVR